MAYHKPVLVEEVLKYLQVESGKLYIDATLGDGGHTLEILKLGGRVLGIDVNQGSLDRARKRIKDSGFEENFVWVKGNFSNIDNLAREKGFDQVNGVLFDLGISTSQLEDETMGLSFKSEYEPDMRLDGSLGVRAFDLINGLHEKELSELIWEYGQERFAKRLAKEIIKARNLERISSAKQLADIALKALPGYEGGRLHPATRLFMALRITVNNELENLKSALPRAGRLLLPGGRMVVLSFHSLEDKIVKVFAQGAQPKDDELVLKELTKKPLEPSKEEVGFNPSSRSAKMRVLERI